MNRQRILFIKKKRRFRNNIIFLFIFFSICNCIFAQIRSNSNKLSNTPDNGSYIKYTENARASKFILEKRIYLIDLTRSMEGFNGEENIFDAVKSQLTETIGSINDPNTEICLIPFTNKVQGLFKSKIENKDSILNYIGSLTTKMGDTNIIDAWKKGTEVLDSTKINYMFMLTDGVHNYGQPVDSLYSELKNWHNISQDKYQFAFYVLLSPAAKEKEVCKIVEDSKQMWLVPSMNLQVNFIVGNMNRSVNIVNNNKIKMHLSCTNPEIFNEGFRFNIRLPENEFYKIKGNTQRLDKDGYIHYEIEKLKPQNQLPISFKTKILISYDKEKYPFVFFTPEEYNLTIANVGTRKMYINALKK